jgi:hypothetical protein
MKLIKKKLVRHASIKLDIGTVQDAMPHAHHQAEHLLTEQHALPIAQQEDHILTGQHAFKHVQKTEHLLTKQNALNNAQLIKNWTV